MAAVFSRRDVKAWPSPRFSLRCGVPSPTNMKRKRWLIAHSRPLLARRGLVILRTIFAFLLIVALPAPAFAANSCAAESADVLARLGIPPAEVRSISVVPEIRSTREGGGRVIGYEAWVRLQSCQGALIVAFTRQCQERQVYTRGDCRIAGLSAY